MFKFCPECGTKNKGWKFCPECGYKLDEQNNALEEELDEEYDEEDNEDVDFDEDFDEDDSSEIASIKNIIAKFKEELLDAENDENTLLSLPVSERKTRQYKQAWQSVQDRKADIMLSLELMRNRLKSMK